VSIQSFIWLPEENNDLMKVVLKQMRDFDMNDIALLPFIILVGGLFGAVKCVIDAKSPWNALFTLLCGACGVIAFGLNGSREEAIRFMDNLKLAAIVTHVADARTCVLHPASHTHRQLSDEQLIEAGVRPDLIRLSVGIENAEDIIADIDQALNA
jgi:O-acetylhomoserine/O-acetylserine sulfhydrylase-like pyridoxal-dependent enzyme